MLSHSAVLHARAERTEQLGLCLHGLGESMQTFPGCLGVEVQQLPDDAAQWLLQSRWQSTAALQQPLRRCCSRCSTRPCSKVCCVACNAWPLERQNAPAR